MKRKPDVRLMMDAVAGILSGVHAGTVQLPVPPRTPAKRIRWTPYYSPRTTKPSPQSKPWTVVGLARTLNDLHTTGNGHVKAGRTTAVLVGLLELLERRVIDDADLDRMAESMNLVELRREVRRLQRQRM